MDGASPENRELRSKLWDISGKRAVYPQLFAFGAADKSNPLTIDGDWKFIGTWEDIHGMVEMNEHDKSLDTMLDVFIRV